MVLALYGVHKGEFREMGCDYPGMTVGEAVTAVVLEALKPSARF